MAEHIIDRRRMLRGAGVAAGGVAISTVGLAAPALADGRSHSRITGSWMVTRQDDGDPAEVQAVFSFTDGGVAIEHDIGPAGPPFTGTWAARQGNRFRATFWTGFPGDEGPGSPGLTVRVQVRGRVRGDTIAGSYTVAGFAPTGEEVFSATGSFSGERIDA